MRLTALTTSRLSSIRTARSSCLPQSTATAVKDSLVGLICPICQEGVALTMLPFGASLSAVTVRLPVTAASLVAPRYRK